MGAEERDMLDEDRRFGFPNSLTMASVQPPFGEKYTSQEGGFSWGRVVEG